MAFFIKYSYDKLKTYFEKVLSGEKVNFQLELQYKEGLKYVDATYVPDFDDEGKVNGFIAHVNDITEKKKTEKEL